MVYGIARINGSTSIKTHAALACNGNYNGPSYNGILCIEIR
jgi:hypothetical protein